MYIYIYIHNENIFIKYLVPNASNRSQNWRAKVIDRCNLRKLTSDETYTPPWGLGPERGAK